MLEEYHKKRDFAKTTEPAGGKELPENKNKNTMLKFVVQKHDATRLHYDFRLESEDGVLKSWAIPKGISLDPKIKRLAVLTEDHPLDYLLFEGVIPAGNYGAGTVIVWDTGTFTAEQELVYQFKNGRITFTLFGHKLKGRFSLIKTSREDQWLLIKANDEFASGEDLAVTKPESVLTGRKVKTNQEKTRDRNPFETKEIAKVYTKDEEAINEKTRETTTRTIPQAFSMNIKPMLATAVDQPFNDKKWVFEIKWDGIRCILFWHKINEILFTMQSRSGKVITHRYPELIEPLKSAIKCKDSIILDGEIVVLDKDGTPSFQNHQRRMNVDHDKEIELLSQQIPANYYLFDILYLDGKNLQGLDFLERRKILSHIIDENSRIKISDFIEEVGKEVFDNVKKMNLEGVVAKYKSSKYLQGVRSREWIKIKTIKTQDCMIIGYTKGEGNREGYFGSLLLAVNNSNNSSSNNNTPDSSHLKFVGHTGSGFNFDQLGQIYDKIKEMKVEKSPIDYIPYVNRDPIWIKPDLVAEVKFSGWTKDKIMRSPIFLRFREDKRPEECIIEEEKKAEEIVQQQDQQEPRPAASSPAAGGGLQQLATNNTTSTSSSACTAYFSNLDKVFWNKTENNPQLTKKDLIDYYDKISKYILPYLKDRPLSLSRYPDGIKGKHFYHKNWDQEKPSFVDSIRIYSKSRGGIVNYLICNNKDTLLWLANLGCIEMHPWFSHVNDFNICKKDTILEDGGGEEKCALNFPDFMVFDLDPYIYSGNENKGEEPEYNVRAFKATVEIAYALKDLFETLNIKSYVKTSGKTGLHIFVPITLSYTYEQTRTFAQVIGKILVKRYSRKITTAWNTAERTGKVFFDHNQNGMGKTVASIFSARPTVSSSVSIPVRWKHLSNILPTDFTILNALEIVKKSGESWNKILQDKQDIRKILEDVGEIKM